MNGIFDLQDIKFVPVEPEKIKTDLVTVYEAVSGQKLYPGDPVRLFLYSVGDMIVQQRILINHAAKMNLLRYASGDFLDQLGAYMETPRLPATPSMTTVRFHLSAPRPEVVLIPAGTRVSPGNDLFFAVAAVGEIKPGELHVDVPVKCLTAGVVGNGYIPGQINILVDPLPFISNVANTTESNGGADEEADDPYRERIYISPERFSVAGPTGAYEYWARTASKDIMNVLVWSPNPGEVEIRVLMVGGELPAQEVLDAVKAACNAETVRPLTDLVTVKAPNVVKYDIDLTYWIDSANATEATTIQTNVQRAIGAYVSWQKSKIGRDINPSELTRLIMNAGARRVAIVSPTFTVVAPTDVAIAGTITANYGGLEND
ncbi:baseplate assembly protein [Paenibacillus tyrfis]|uniref:Baseplate J protein n=1 Tax=Paenibacillus tyrfis TaxID=1501230 RepID=A0A081NV27_9BACL|nr:baseplate J/gp47 family protein [Paenibacillus tyrfis]KEQ22300.1 baseplate J protein [Paenibacillus tyrfis]